GIEVRSIQLVEALRFSFLLSEKLDDAHPRQPLLQERIDSSDPYPDLAIGLTHTLSKETGNHHDERNYREGRQRQTPVHDQHRHADRHQREQIAEPGNDSSSE